ncbi:hypothetical protein [Teredinibacter franksiae]|uniref:hypothetical protein n=1 Tax=Teredinibacter franksiae TaxID=2761453 RepID=UPI001629C428|nr:hypothetical protein [Teredinibacter franksiae]
MNSLSNKLHALIKLISITVLSLTGGCAMSADIELNWEWPADRQIEQRVLIKIEKIKEQGSGFFGLKKSPSLAASVPDPVVITGTVLGEDKLIAGKTISVVAPKLEVESISAGGFAVAGIVETDICICLVAVESANADISAINCP